MYRILLLWVCLGVLVWGIPAAAQDETVASTAFTLTETTPIAGDELAPDGVLEFVFNRVLDCQSVTDTTVSILPLIEGEWACSLNSITFIANATFEEQTTYTIRFAPDLRAVDGSTLGAELRRRFSTPGFLRVRQLLPANGTTDIMGITPMTAIFNRPVVPLTLSPDTANLPVPFTISPEVEGEGEWINTFIYSFTPSEVLLPHTTYTLTIDPTLTTADGVTMSEPATWTFTTGAPELTSITPRQDGKDVTLDTPVILRFNVPMPHDLIEQAFFVRPSDFPSDFNMTGTWTWDESSLEARFIPDTLLTLETVYVAGMDMAKMLDENGQPFALAGTTEWRFTTLPYPRYLGPAPKDGAYTDIYSGFGLLFNTYMDADSITERLTIDPEPPEGFFTGYRTQKNYTGAFAARASTTYTIRVEPGYKDMYGNAVDTPIEFSYTTYPYDPAFNLAIPGGPIGFYNAYYDQTAVFIQHRNIDWLKLNLYSVPLPEFMSMLQGDRNSSQRLYEYEPSVKNLLRSVDFQVKAPENVFKPTMLPLGSIMPTCDGAPESRLRVGDTAQVITDTPQKMFRGHLTPDQFPGWISPDSSATPDVAMTATAQAQGNPSNATPIPQDAVLYKGFAARIVGESYCLDNKTLLWRVQLADGSLGWLPENEGDEYVLEPVVMQSGTLPVGGPDSDALAPGVYALNVSLTDPNMGRPYEWNHFMLVSTAVLTMKSSLNTITVWATDVASGKPIPSVPITVYGRDGILAGGITDGNGLMTIVYQPEAFSNIYSQNFYALLKTDQHFGVGSAQWSQGIDPGNFGLKTSYGQDAYTIYMYTDRAAYRPGETVYYRGIIRRKDDMRYYAPDMDSIFVSFNNGAETIVKELDVSPYGSFSGSFELVENAPLGSYYTLRAITEDTPYYPSMMREINFGVAEFQLPEFEVTLKPELSDVVQGETVRVTLDSRYYFGGAVANATLDYTVITQAYSFSYRGRGRYRFESYDGYDYRSTGQGYGRRIAEGTATTDENGMFVIEVPAELSNEGISQRFVVEATVRDKTDRTVTGANIVNIHAGEIYVGSRPEKYVGRQNQENTIHLIVVDLDSKPVMGRKLDAELTEVKWNNVQERDDQGRTAWVWERELIPVTTARLTTGENGMVDFTFTPERGGTYQLTTTTRDNLGNVVTNVANVWVSGSQYVSWRQDNSNRIELVANAENYNVGETAEILITSPFQGEATALITVERAGILAQEVITLTTNSYLYQLPIQPEFAPNVFVSVMIIKGVDENNPVAGFRMGTVALKVNTERKVMKLEVSADTEQAQPQQTVTYTIKATDYKGDPVQAELGVQLTDAAALAIGTKNHGDLLPFYYSETGISVRTGSPLTMNVDQITQNIIDSIKGGGGGGLVLPFNFEVRGDFVSTPYWNGALVTDANGEATFSVRLPDNLTTWRLDAKAVSLAPDGNMLVGQTTHDLISTRPVLIRPVTPRFFVVGDEVTLAAVVNNNTDEDLPVTIKLESFGIRLLDGATQTQSMTIPARGSVRADWRATVLNVEGVNLIFAVESTDGRFNDAAQPALGGDTNTLPVYRFEVQETVATSGVMREDETRTETINLPAGWDITEGALTVRIDSSLAATSTNALRALRGYRYYSESIPYVVSRLLPNVATYRAVTQLGLDKPDLKQEVEREIDYALQRLYSGQRADGGWGWYWSETSDPLTTAYALIGLAEADANGFPITGSVIVRARDYIRSFFIVPDLSQSNWRLNRQAFFLYALAQSNAPDVARTANLYEQRHRLNTDAKVYLALTLHQIQADDPRLATLVADFTSTASVSATGMHWEETYWDRWNWSSNTRTTALVLKALITLDPESDLIPQGIRWLMSVRENAAWETDQETAWAVLTLTDWMLLTGELDPNYTYQVAFNDNLLTMETPEGGALPDTEIVTIPVSDMDESNELTIEREGETGVLYYTGHLRALLPVPAIEPLDAGIIIQRQYSLFNDEEAKPITEARVGDIVRVQLTIIAPDSLHYVTIEDPIPSGAEAIDPQLPINPQQETQVRISRARQSTYGWGWWYFQNREFKDEKVRLTVSYLPAGTYEIVYTMRLGLPGVYNVIPPTAYETYFPEVYGRGAGMAFTILPAE